MRLLTESFMITIILISEYNQSALAEKAAIWPDKIFNDCSLQLLMYEIRL